MLSHFISRRNQLNHAIKIGSKKGKTIDKELSRKISKFRSSARQEYAKGRSFDAADLQKQVLELGSKNLPRFDEYSLVKAHALLELGLATSAICTDFVRGVERKEKCDETQQVLNEALQIYHYRLADGTLTKWRKEEVWLRGKNSYESPVPHTERLGPVDFLTCTNMACGFFATPESVASLKKDLRLLDSSRPTDASFRWRLVEFLKDNCQVMPSWNKSEKETSSLRERAGWSTTRPRERR
jgi:hypothetical protein